MRLGYRPDPPDHRDFSARELLAAAPVPEFASWRSLIVDVLDQGQASSCVANAIMQAVRASHVRQGIQHPRLGSRLFAYYMSRALHQEANRDEGTFLRTCFQALNTWGFPPEADVWPYDVAKVCRRPPFSVQRAALDQASPTEYRRIYSTGPERVDDIKRAVALGHLVAFGTLVSRDFARNRLPSGVLKPPIGQEIAGGHALLVCGFDGDRFDVVNSWGEDWGDRGYCTFSADYMTWSETRDLWLVSHSPNYSE